MRSPLSPGTLGATPEHVLEHILAVPDCRRQERDGNVGDRLAHVRLAATTRGGHHEECDVRVYGAEYARGEESARVLRGAVRLGVSRRPRAASVRDGAIWRTGDWRNRRR